MQTRVACGSMNLDDIIIVVILTPFLSSLRRCWLKWASICVDYLDSQAAKPLCIQHVHMSNQSKHNACDDMHTCAPVHVACNAMRIYAIALTSMQSILFALHTCACIGLHVPPGRDMDMPMIAGI